MPVEPKPSLRARQIEQTRAALVEAGRSLFGRKGFAATSVDELAAEAGLTTGALYHHFETKAHLFEAVCEVVHIEVLRASRKSAIRARGEVEQLARAFDAFLDEVLKPDVQRIIVTDAPAVLGVARFTELDEKYAFSEMAGALRRASAAGSLKVNDPETVARLLLGALTRGAMLIANAADPRRTRNEVARAMRQLLGGLSA